MSDSLKEIEFLASSAHRVGVLAALDDRPQDRTDLRAATGASSPTMGRILADFQDRCWIERDENTYRLTALGAFVTDQFHEFEAAMTIQRQLRDVWPWLPHEIDGFNVESLTDAVVSQPGAGYPYQPVERLGQLLTETTTMRGFGMAILKSANLTPFFDRIRDDLECEYIYPPTVFEELLSWNRTTVLKAASRANYTVLVHDELPITDRCGICLFDDQVSICCFDHETGTLRSLVDTESDEMRSWALSYYEQFREEARPLAEADDLVSAGSFQ